MDNSRDIAETVKAVLPGAKYISPWWWSSWSRLRFFDTDFYYTIVDDRIRMKMQNGQVSIAINTVVEETTNNTKISTLYLDAARGMADEIKSWFVHYASAAIGVDCSKLSWQDGKMIILDKHLSKKVKLSVIVNTTGVILVQITRNNNVATRIDFFSPNSFRKIAKYIASNQTNAIRNYLSRVEAYDYFYEKLRSCHGIHIAWNTMLIRSKTIPHPFGILVVYDPNTGMLSVFRVARKNESSFTFIKTFPSTRDVDEIYKYIDAAMFVDTV
jgi:hypothetical protein